MNNICIAALAAVVITCAPASALADSLELSYLDPHYTYHSIELGVPFGGAIAPHASDENILYVSAGSYGAHTILEVQLDTGTTRTVSPLVGNVGGLAMLQQGDLAITDNDDVSSNTILRARDLNEDGDWLDTGEISELIAPILTQNFSGAQLAVTPAAENPDIPPNALVLQTADGGSDSEILVIENPDSAPAYRPADGAYYSGFMFNGGIGFTADGHLICGVSEFPSARITALVNINGDEDIDPGEARDIVTSASLPNSIADLSVTLDGLLLTSENSGTIRSFELPPSLDGTTSGSILAQTNGTYISAVRLSAVGNFKPGSEVSNATLFVGGFVTFPAATNLLAISLKAPSAATGWEVYE